MNKRETMEHWLKRHGACGDGQDWALVNCQSLGDMWGQLMAQDNTHPMNEWAVWAWSRAWIDVLHSQENENPYLHTWEGWVLGAIRHLLDSTVGVSKYKNDSEYVAVRGLLEAGSPISKERAEELCAVQGLLMAELRKQDCTVVRERLRRVLAMATEIDPGCCIDFSLYGFTHEVQLLCQKACREAFPIPSGTTSWSMCWDYLATLPNPFAAKYLNRKRGEDE